MKRCLFFFLMLSLPLLYIRYVIFLFDVYPIESVFSILHINYHYHLYAIVNPCHLAALYFLIDAESLRVKDGISHANRRRMRKSVTYLSLLFLSRCIVLLFFIRLNLNINVSKMICNSILCPAIQTRVCNRHIIEA